MFFQSREDILPGGVLSLYRTGRLCVKRSSLAAGWSSLCTDFWGIENDSRRKEVTAFAAPWGYISPQCGLNGVPRWRQNSEFPVCLTSKY